MQRRAKISTNSSLGIALLHKYYFMLVKLCNRWHFLLIELKKWEEMMCFCGRLLVIKCLKIQVKIGLPCLDTILVHLLRLVYLFILE